MTDISLFEFINKEKLQEVIECGNLPFGDKDEPIWKEQFQKQLKFYDKKKFKKDKGIEIKYSQPNKFGRYISKCGLQMFQKDVRKYISGEYIYDLDFKNCTPYTLKQLFKLNNIRDDDFLDEYVNDRKLTMDKYKIKDKIEVICAINNDKIPVKKNYKDLHNRIYKELIPKLLKEDSNKQLLKRIKLDRNKKKKKYNYTGSFLAHYLQDIENTMLMSLYNYCNENYIKVETLCFDGLTVLKDSFELTDKFLRDAEDRIFADTGYKMTIVSKPTDTDWVPIKAEITNDIINTDRFLRSDLNRLYNECVDGDDKIELTKIKQIVIPYLNQHFCMINEPFSYGWKLYSNQERYKILNEDQVRRIIGTKYLELYKDNDNIIIYYDNIVFDPTNKHKKTELNTYIRPKMNDDESINIFERCPKWFDFLKNFMFPEDESCFTYSTHYISKIVKTGKTEQGLIFQGLMGTGKSKFTELLGKIIGDEYCGKTSDIMSLQKQFNKNLENKILYTVEEIPLYSNNYRVVNEMIKEYITGKNINIEPKNVDSYEVKSFINLIFNTNNCSALKVPEGNRRLFVSLVSTKLMNNYEFFSKLTDEIELNVEYLRHYYYTYDEVNRLNSIRPITKAEINMRELTQDPIEQFVKTLDIKERYPLDDMYDVYNKFLEENEYKGNITCKLFKSQISIYKWQTIRTKINGSTNVNVVIYKDY